MPPKRTPVAKNQRRGSLDANKQRRNSIESRITILNESQPLNQQNIAPTPKGQRVQRKSSDSDTSKKNVKKARLQRNSNEPSKRSFVQCLQPKIPRFICGQSDKRSCWKKVLDYKQNNRSMTEGDDAMSQAPGKKGDNQPMLTGAEEVAEEDHDSPMEVQTYSQTLHHALKFLWIPMFCIGRIPFRLSIQKNKATIIFKKLSVSYLVCAIGAAACWLLFIWYTINIGILMFEKDESQGVENDKKFLQKRIMRKYWIDIFVFWTTLLQAAFASTHILIFGENYATFVKHWYQVLDTSKTQISKSLVQFILIHYALLFSVVVSMCLLFAMPKSYPPFTRTCELIVAPYIRPFFKANQLQDDKKNWYFEKWAFLGLFIYIVAVIFAWFSIIIYLVFARCFRNALHLMNQRIRMMLHPFDEPKIGPNAIRLDYSVIHKDFVQISFVGIKAGYVFGHVICCFYMTSTLCVVFELGNLASFGSDNPTTPENIAARDAFYPQSNIRKTDPAAATVFNLVGHLFLSIATIVVSAWENAECYREGREAYQLATYKGLYSATTQLERNFIRSIWILASEKFPLTVTSQGYFRMTRGMLIAFLSCIVTYFIFLVQSKGQIEAITIKAESPNSPNVTTVSTLTFSDSDPDNFKASIAKNGPSGTFFWSFFP